MKQALKILILIFCISQQTFTSYYDAIVQTALSNDSQRLQNLIDQGVDINIKDADGNSPLFHILLYEPSLNFKIDEHENTKIIHALQLLLDYGADYMTMNHDGEKFLFFLISKNNIIHTTIFDYLLKNFLSTKDFLATDMHGNTLLMKAAMCDNPYVVQQLHNYYNKQHDTNTYLQPYNDYGYSALGLARRYNHRDISGYLVAHGAKKERDLSKTRLEHLFIGAYDNNIPLIQDRLHHGTPIDLQNKKTGDTALLIATREGHLKTVQYLLERGANPNIANKFQQTPLLTAMQLEPNRIHLELVQSLMNYNASPQAQDNKGNTACMLATENHLMQIFMTKYCAPAHKKFSYVVEV